MFIVVLIFVLAYYGTILTGENKVVAFIALVLTILYVAGALGLHGWPVR